MSCTVARFPGFTLRILGFRLLTQVSAAPSVCTFTHSTSAIFATEMCARAQTTKGTPVITLGCDYNPEQWPAEVWAEDVALMREAGIRLVAINVFGWSEIEPRPGEYDFKNLDAVVELLHE